MTKVQVIGEDVSFQAGDINIVIRAISQFEGEITRYFKDNAINEVKGLFVEKQGDMQVCKVTFTLLNEDKVVFYAYININKIEVIKDIAQPNKEEQHP